MSPWVDGKWKPPTAQQRQERGLSQLPAAKPTTAAEAQRDVFGGGASPGMMGKLAEAFGEQPTQPTQQDAGIWNWIKDKYYQAVGTAQGGIDPRVEAKITGEPMPGTSMIELLGIGAIASAPMLLAKASAGAAGAIVAPDKWARAAAGLPPTARELKPIDLTATQKALEAQYTKYAWRTSPGDAMIKDSIKKAVSSYATKQPLAKIGGTAANFATNTATKAATQSLWENIGLTLPASLLAISVIGSYPFAGFIKEESLQTLSFGVRTATENGDIEGAETAMAFQEELLNPNTQRKIISQLPFTNVVSNLNDFFKAARIKLAIDKKLIDDLKIKQETGKTDDKIWAQRREEKTTEEKALIDYYNQQRLIAENAILAARKEHNNEEREAWMAHKLEILRLEKIAREEQAAFWLEYLKAKQKLLENQGRSHLGFGLLK